LTCFSFFNILIDQRKVRPGRIAFPQLGQLK
jgi:hypothetical protein